MKNEISLFRYALAVLVIISLFTGCIGKDKEPAGIEDEISREEEKDIEVKEKKVQWAWVEREEEGFKVKYPISWDKLEKELLELYGYDIGSFVVAFGKYRNESLSLIAIFVEPLSRSQLKKDELTYKTAQNLLDNQKKEEPKTELISLSNITLDGEKATKLVYIDHELWTEEAWIISIKGKNMYSIAYSTTPQRFKEDSSMIDEMLDSFRFRDVKLTWGWLLQKLGLRDESLQLCCSPLYGMEAPSFCISCVLPIEEMGSPSCMA
jgi:hypothetical protein